MAKKKRSNGAMHLTPTSWHFRCEAGCDFRSPLLHRHRACQLSGAGDRGRSEKNMNHFTLILISFTTFLCSCSSTPIVGDLSPQSGSRQAQRDYTSGHPKIYEAGGYAVYEPGIPDDERTIVATLPRNGSLAGCTNPKVRYSVGYASAYNREILSLIKRDGLPNKR